MCYSGICKQEDSMGNCTWHSGNPPCPDDYGPLTEEEEEEKRILERIW